uniref:Uncharacterized protein n=1 Tax=Arundo donax TaxID=35708 RepID=A0A0A8ZE24_ARUDO
MEQYVFGTLDELDAFVFWISHGLSLEGGLLFWKDHMDSLGSSPSARSHSAQKRTNSSKNSPNLRKSQNLTHGQMQQRLHPGLSSSQNRATAHYGAVTGLRTTTDGMHLLSSGSDSRLELWDIDSGCNTLDWQAITVSCH